MLFFVIRDMFVALCFWCVVSSIIKARAVHVLHTCIYVRGSETFLTV